MLEPILSVFLLIVMGVVLRRTAVLPAEFFPSVEKFSGNIAFPALIFSGTAALPFVWSQMADLALITLSATVIVFATVLLLLRYWPGLPNAARSSIVQGAVRPNSYLGITVAALFFPPKTAALLMLALAIGLPIVNVMAVVVLSWWGNQAATPRGIAKSVLLHPVIVATLAGLAVSISGLQLPAPLREALAMLGKSSLALGLLCVGGGLTLMRAELRLAPLAVAGALKLLLMPLLAAVACRVLGVTGPMALVACFYSALPTAPNAYLLAKQMGGDARLMASLITVQTMLAPLSLPVSQQMLGWLS